MPAIYTKLLDVDKVELVVGPYATAQIAPAMPIVMQKKKTFIGLLGLAVNTEFNYPNYFAMIPSGPDAKPAFTKGFFDVAMAQGAKPQTVAIVAADQEFSRNAADGARENAKAANLRVVYDRTYPPSTADFAPIVRAIQASNPDLVVVCSYPPDSVGIVRAVNEIGFKPKAIGGAMVGLQATAIKTQLGPLLNGWINYDFWLPVPKMEFAGVGDLIKRYQAKAGAEGVDPLGYYMAPWGYAQLQVLQQAVEGTKSLDDAQARRLHPRQHVQDRGRRREVRRQGRMGKVARAAGPVPERQGQRRRPVQGHVHAGRGGAGRVRIRQGDLSVREGEVSAGLVLRGASHQVGQTVSSELRCDAPQHEADRARSC